MDSRVRVGEQAGEAELIRERLMRGLRDAELLDGRDFDPVPWRVALDDLARLLVERDAAERALRGVGALVATTACLKRPQFKNEPWDGPCGKCAPCFACRAMEEWRDFRESREASSLNPPAGVPVETKETNA